jgi:hypothetical protein
MKQNGQAVTAILPRVRQRCKSPSASGHFSEMNGRLEVADYLIATGNNPDMSVITMDLPC